MKFILPLCLASCLVTAACGNRAVEVDHPFYLTSIEDSGDIALFRCPDGPKHGCAVDGLPGPRVLRAGANKRYVVVAQQPLSDAERRTAYYYFARVPEESGAYGMNPEKIIGPIDESQFQRAKASLDLPEFSVEP